MKAYTLLYDDTMPELPGAELALVLHHIKMTCNDFYDRSLYGREVLAGVTVTSGVASYTITASDAANFEVSKVLEVRLVNGANSTTQRAHLYPRTPAQLNIDMPNWDTQTGTPKFYTQTAVDNVTLAYVPGATYASGLVVTIAKLPLYAGAGIDDAVYGKFSDALGYGVKARLMRMPKKPWSNPGLAKEYRAEFDLEVAAAAAMAASGYGQAPLRTRACP